MPSLKEIRTRIASVESTQKITSAMKLVSAAKLRRAQNAIYSLRPYSNKLNEILQNLSFDIADDHPLFTVRKPENVVLIAITSNRGLCGAFNSNVIKETHRVISENYKNQQLEKKLKLICIGKKAVEQLQKNYEVMYANEALLDAPYFEEVAKLASDLIDDFTHKKIDKIVIIYNRFVNPATQKISHENFLPIINVEEKPAKKTKKKIKNTIQSISPIILRFQEVEFS
jgi:F-type H+-transporting ATPase subunit gamma